MTRPSVRHIGSATRPVGAEGHSSIEREPVMVSVLEHYSYCPRQYALIHREQTYDENVYTMRGSAAHERVHEETTTMESGVRLERSSPIWSEELGLVGKADLVEFHGETPSPVEYKHGRRKPDRHADLQLCAQAMCLEEMFGLEVPRGAVYHVSSNQRREVLLTKGLRQRVREVLDAIRQIDSEERLPPPVNDRRCPPCSLIESCIPKVGANARRLRSLHVKLFELED